MKLELKHLAPYLPYGLQMLNTKSGRIIDVIGLRDTVSATFLITTTNDYQLDLWPFSPLLYPLSALDKAIFSYGIYPSYLEDIIDGKKQFDLQDCPYWLLETLIENHYDVFGLIDAGLAIDKTTVI